MITIAGSGPSCADYNQPVTIATKKRSLPSEYLFCRFSVQYNKFKGPKIPMLLYFNRCTREGCRCPLCSNDPDVEIIPVNSGKWDEYWKPFIRKKKLSSHMKPSLGTCAVFAAVEKWGVDEVGVIGFDNILDGNEEWIHDPIAELACIESLVNVVDLRGGQRT